MQTKKAVSHNQQHDTSNKFMGGVAAAWFQKHFNEDAPNEYGVLHQRRIARHPNSK
jgi:hypothetical protein